MDNNDKKPKSDKPLEKPHYYGDIDGVHVFHATHEDHQYLVGQHVEDPTDEELNTSMEEAKKIGTPVVVVHGAPPPKLRHKIELSKTETPKTLMKTLTVQPIHFGDLQKAFLQPDQITQTDLKTHIAALDSLPESLKEWGVKNLVPLKKDAIETLELEGRKIKVRKHDADLYSGWVEHEGNKVHQFDRVTMPEMLSQLQSKFEMYGKGPEPVSPDKEEFNLSQMIDDHMRSRGHEPTAGWEQEPFQEASVKDRAKKKLKAIKSKSAFDETPEDEAKEKQEFHAANSSEKREDMIFDELNEVEEQLKEHHASVQGNEVTLPHKEIAQGLLSTEAECSECGSKEGLCDCYSGLPKPQIEMDYKNKKVTILFKSDWDEEAKSAFIKDLKDRAKHIIGRLQ